MPAIYPVDAFECIGTDWGRSDHDYGTTVCHQCFDAIYPWTEKWGLDHKRVTWETIRPGGTLKYAMLSGDNHYSTTIERCDLCDRIVTYAYCTKDRDDQDDQPCECDTCLPEAYAEDDAKIESGEYAAIRTRISYQEHGFGSRVPEWCKARQPKVDGAQA